MCNGTINNILHTYISRPTLPMTIRAKVHCNTLFSIRRIWINLRTEDMTFFELIAIFAAHLANGDKTSLLPSNLIVRIEKCRMRCSSTWFRFGRSLSTNVLKNSTINFVTLSAK